MYESEINEIKSDLFALQRNINATLQLILARLQDIDSKEKAKTEKINKGGDKN